MRLCRSGLSAIIRGQWLDDFQIIFIGKRMTALEELEGIEIKATETDADEDGFISIWNIASASCDGDLEKTRALAAQLLGFLCKKDCDFVVVSTTDAEYLDAWFERDNKLLYDWKPESETVDVLSQHAEVPREAFACLFGEPEVQPEDEVQPQESRSRRVVHQQVECRLKASLRRQLQTGTLASQPSSRSALSTVTVNSYMLSTIALRSQRLRWRCLRPNLACASIRATRSRRKSRSRDAR